MGLLLSILFSYVGAVELMFIVRDIVHRVGLHHEKMKFNRDLSKVTASLHGLQDDLRNSIKSAQLQLYETDTIHSMADGVQYEDGYRISAPNEQNIDKRWMAGRANLTIQPSQFIDANNVENNQVVAYSELGNSTNENRNNCNDPLRIDLQNRDSRSINDETIVKNAKSNESNEFGNTDEQQQRNNYKTTHPSDTLQRRRSKDIDGECDNPWGELRPESFHDTNLWSRERAMSIAENEETDEKLYHENSKRQTNPLRSITTRTMVDREQNEVNESDETQKPKDVSNEIEYILPDCFDDDFDADNNKQKRNRLPEILVVSSDMTEIVNDGKIDELIDYIEHIDSSNSSVSDKLQFKEYLEQPKRLRHSSYNYDTDKDTDDKLYEFSIVENDERVSTKDVPNENETNDSISKRSINNRKPNMFAFASSSSTTATITSTNQLGTDDNQQIYRPLVRITTTEDERVEQFLHEEHIDNIHRSSGDILIKSKTTQTFDCRDESVSDIDSYDTDSRTNTPTYDIVNRRESTLSDIGSEPIQFECKQPENPNYIYKRADSLSSTKSNVLFERSQSRFSELEYIKGRDDWKDDYHRCEINEEFDSDNYHHLRRHSETAETLEYIRGREDWLRNEFYRNHQNSLPRIFEVGEPKIMIQDEIDSDEYHHNFFQHEMLRSISTESTTTKINQSSFECDTQIDNNQIKSNKNHSIDTQTNDRFVKNNGKINVVIDNLIKHDTPGNDDIEITVWNLTPEPQKSNPFILISEAADDNYSTSIDLNLQQSIGHLHPDSIEMSNSDNDNEINVNNLTDVNKQSNEVNDSNMSNTSDGVSEFLYGEIQSETSARQRCQSESEQEIEFETAYGTTSQNNRNIRAKSEMTGLLNPSVQKPRRTLSFENVDDLIQDVCNGPWFHI